MNVDRTFLPCSGQSYRANSKRHWGIYKPNGQAWWRACGKSGKQRVFGSYKAAEKAALIMESEPPCSNI